MPTSTYTPIASTTFPGSTGVVTFSSIPSTYTDLVLVINAGITSASSDFYMRFNGDTGTNYSSTFLAGNGSSASSTRTTSTSLIYLDWYGATVANSVNANYIVNIQNYSNTTTNKTALVRANLPQGAAVETNVSLWRSTAAINSITIGPNGGNIVANSTFTLYGIKAGS